MVGTNQLSSDVEREIVVAYKTAVEDWRRAKQVAEQDRDAQIENKQKELTALDVEMSSRRKSLDDQKREIDGTRSTAENALPDDADWRLLFSKTTATTVPPTQNATQKLAELVKQSSDAERDVLNALNSYRLIRDDENQNTSILGVLGVIHVSLAIGAVIMAATFGLLIPLMMLGAYNLAIALIFMSGKPPQWAVVSATAEYVGAGLLSIVLTATSTIPPISIIAVWMLVVLFLVLLYSPSSSRAYSRPSRLQKARKAAEQSAQKVIALTASARSVYEQAQRVDLIELARQHDEKRRTINTAIQRIKEQFATAQAASNSMLREKVAELRDQLDTLLRQLGYGGLDLSDALWQRWEMSALATQLSAVRLSALTDIPSVLKDSPAFLLDQPTVMPLTLERALLIEASGSAKQQAVDAIQALLFRLVAALAPGTVQFTFIDPISLGQNVAGFMALGEYDRRLVDGKAWTEPEHIEERLLALTEQVEVIIQKNLRNDYFDIEDYNDKNDIKLPYHVVVIFDFPTNLRDDALRRILSLATQGARCGFYPIILRDTSQPAPRDFNMDGLRQACTRITLDGSRFVWDDPAFRDYGLTLDAAPNDKLLKRVIEVVGPQAAVADRVEYPFKEIAPAEERDWWKERADSSLDVPLGPSEGHKKQKFHVDEENRVSGLIVGQPGSGKSTLLHTLLTNLALRYPPDDVRLYLVDMKQGVEFEAFARERLPHARVVAIDSDREFGLSVLREVAAELDRRGELFRRNSIQNLAQYRRSGLSSEPMPRILVAIDEFHRLFDEDDDIAAQSSSILDHLLRQGRAYGIHLLLATQTLDGQRRLSRATKDLIQVRIALQSSDTDSRLALAEDNGAARLLSRPGEAIYNDNIGRIDANHQFQVAYLSRDDQTEYLRLLHAKARKEGKSGYDQIIFDGNRAVEMSERAAIGSALASKNWPPTPYPLHAWVGEPVEIRDSVAATLRRQSGANLLVMGQRSDLALGVVTSALVGLAAQMRPASGTPEQLAQFYVADLSPADNSAAESLEQVRAALPHDMRVVRSRYLPEVVTGLAAEVDRRLALRDDPSDAALAPIVLTIFGLQSARDLRPDDSYSGMDGGGFRFGEAEVAPALSPSQAFMKVLRDGPEVGIHAVVWCDTTSNLDRSIPRGGLREFALRAVFRSSREDSQSIINSAAAETLPPYRALLYDDDSNALTKFRPYAVPSDEWLQYVRAQLLERR